jgi:endo-1,4-beta-D-glucanase Y
MAHRITSRRTVLFLSSASLATTLAAAGCGASGSGNGGSAGGRTTGPASGGQTSTGTGGSNGIGTGASTSTGGLPSTGTGTGGSTQTGPGAGGSGGVPATGAGGSIATTMGGAGAMVTGGTGGAPATGNRTCAVASPDVISDFEEGTGVMVKQGGRSGVWYAYADPAAGTQTPAPAPAATPEKIAVAASGDTTNMCDKWSFHSTAAGHPMYVGFGGTFVPAAPPSTLKSAYDVSAYKGISFKIKSGGGTPPAVYFEVLTKETQPATVNGVAASGTATVATVDTNNNRGWMLNTPWITTGISTTWQTIYVPFGGLMARWLPAVGGGQVCPPAGAGVPKCQAPKFNPANVLGFQFSMYPDPGFPTPAGSTLGTYDLWVDDVQFVKDDTALLPTRPGFPNDGPVGSCVKPTGAAGKFMVQAYNLWKQTFVVSAGGGMRVQRPENGNDTVSEGIGYGMLIAVYMNDQPLFDGLWTYWKANQATADGPLMTWQIPGGTGTATDADEDAAFAMLEASKKWPTGGYGPLATSLMHGVLAEDMSGAFIKGGNQYTAAQVTNPSYFAPAWYREFAKADTANAAAWNGLAAGAYTLLSNIGGSSANGLYAAWCSANCTAVSANRNATDDVLYQYDSHRIPWRFGLDYCWNGTAAAKTYLSGKIIKFFATNAAAGLNGVGRISDKYSPGGAAQSPVVNSASIIGSAGVGAMADAQYQTFLDDSYQLVLDLVNRGSLGDPTHDPTKTAYSYYNATVGLLSLLSMTGNLHPL